MKVTETTFIEQHPVYATPQATVTEILSEGILCYSTETLQEDTWDPWK